VSLLQAPAFAIAGIIHALPGPMSRLHDVSGRRPYAVLGDVERSFAAYLAAEKQRGRVAAETDAETLAFVLLGAIHHSFMTNLASAPGVRKRIGRAMPRRGSARAARRASSFGPGLATRDAARITTAGVVVGVDHSPVMLRHTSRRNRVPFGPASAPHLGPADDICLHSTGRQTGSLRSTGGVEGGGVGEDDLRVAAGDRWLWRRAAGGLFWRTARVR
jgi:hypothetical protein